MANLIILEGLSRTGKTSISKLISSNYGYRSLSIKNKMPDYVKNLPDFYHGMQVYSNEIFRAFPDQTFILDRSFLSELVYSRFFNRSSYIKEDGIIEDLLQNNFILVYLNNDHENYMKRSPKDKIIYTKSEFESQKMLFDSFFNEYQNLNKDQKWKNRFVEISTIKNSIYECEEKINSKIKQYINLTA
jgi:thymidylate kinase